MKMERFYERWLLGIAHKHPETLYIAKRFFCPGWKKVNANAIQKTNVKNEFLVPNIKKNTELFYIINSEIGICFYSIRISDTSCKHQEAVLVKFHISIFNFIPSLTLNDHIIYAYIAFGK